MSKKKLKREKNFNSLSGNQLEEYYSSDNKKNKYKINKYLAIEYCKYMIEENEKIDKKFHELYDSSKKKDDLADCYLQGIYYIDKLGN